MDDQTISHSLMRILPFRFNQELHDYYSQPEPLGATLLLFLINQIIWLKAVSFDSR